MNITVFGASGGIGSHVIALAAQRGHHVRGVYRTAPAPARLICVSTASVGPADNVMGAAPRLLLRFFRTVAVPNLGRVGQDLRAMESELAASGLDWYAVRPVKLTDGPLTGNIQASDRFKMKTISRADVAWHILGLAENPAPGPQRTPVLTSGTSRTTRTPHPGGQTPGKAPATPANP